MRSDTLRTDAKTLPPVPTANVESEKRKSLDQESKKVAKNGAARKGSAAKEAKKSTNRSVRKSEKSAKDADRDRKSSEHRTKDTSDRDAKANGKKFTLEPEKYAHLPVYDKKEEARKAREREKKVSEIFNGK